MGRTQGGPASFAGRAALVALAALCLPPGARAAGVGVVARHGDSLTAQIDPGDTDSFAVDLSQGGSLSVKAAAAKGSALLPEVRLFRPDGSEAALGAVTKGAGTPKVSFANFPAGP